MERKLFVNLPVSKLDRAVSFFTALGFEFNPDFTYENATCMLVGKDAFVMLLVRDFFATFTDRPVADPATSTAAIIAISAESRDGVDQLVDTALAQGASAGATQDHGFMYSRAFYDLDGHHWEVLWMDESQISA
ncbi:glyoxalase/bleomycin resistance/extradiol dioxygenase family protein [Lipingzhangella sp. LS1_29]|uniref:Glyoxalase/bleomycin resistance/extradiol dioxygenase family protein n=1 Tax=Lipingzhangella rawalii TaxID=2055835 RepID=A0ABU2H146_9ACTN|nr:VOC family protein [Lipingzhangella rawalii]MDS1269026.1 glyoxalase/bleomycin resistance/extradiol dioxygenase family protein [Lipingzhangella rawalii]